MKAIETVWDGYRFRSRLEARWAVFFKTLGLPYEYEKEGYDLGELGWYLPDFWIPCPSDQYPDAGYWYEIKGQEPTFEEQGVAQALAMHTNHTAFIARGLPGEHYLFWAHRTSRTGWRGAPACFQGEDPESFELWVEMLRWDIPWPECARAILAARQARFEHGERPQL